MRAAGEEHLGLAFGRAQDLAQVLHVATGLGVGNRFVKAVEDEEEMAFPVELKESLRIERLRRSEALKMLGEQAFQSDRGGAALSEVNQDRGAGGRLAVRQLFLGFQCELAGQAS